MSRNLVVRCVFHDGSRDVCPVRGIRGVFAFDHRRARLFLDFVVDHRVQVWLTSESYAEMRGSHVESPRLSEQQRRVRADEASELLHEIFVRVDLLLVLIRRALLRLSQQNILLANPETMF